MSINDKNRNNKIDQKGLYGETNLDSYLRKIIRKGVNMEIVPEYLAKITLYAKEEILMQEYARRIALWVKRWSALFVAIIKPLFYFVKINGLMTITENFKWRGENFTAYADFVKIVLKAS